MTRSPADPGLLVPVDGIAAGTILLGALGALAGRRRRRRARTELSQP